MWTFLGDGVEEVSVPSAIPGMSTLVEAGCLATLLWDSNITVPMNESVRFSHIGTVGATQAWNLTYMATVY